MYVLNNIVIPGLTSGCLYALVAVGFSVLERGTRILNFSHGDIIMWAAFAPIVTSTLWGFPEWLALLSAPAAAVVFGLLVERIAMRPFIGRSEEFGWILTTLGCSVILEQLATEPFGGQDEAFPFHLALSPISKSVELTPQVILLFVCTLACAILLYVISRRTMLGHRLEAVQSDPEGAIALGIAPRRMSQLAMLLAVVTATVAGVTIAPLLVVSPTFGFNLTFIGFVAAAIGGLGSLSGAFVGGIAVGFIIQLASLYLGANWTNTVLFGALLLVYLVRPWGLLGRPPARVI